MGRLVAGQRDDVQHPAAEVERGAAARPAGQTEEVAHRRDRVPDDRGEGPIAELGVAGDVVAVRVRVDDEQLVSLARMGGQPLLEQRVDVAPNGNAAGSDVAPVSSSSARSPPAGGTGTASNVTDRLCRSTNVRSS